MMEWIKGEIVGRGSFGTVNLATPRKNYSQIPSLMAVKSSIHSQSSMLYKEKELLTTQFNDCPQIIKCFGDDHTIENGVEFYNVFLEFASRGNLAQLIRAYSIPEFEIRRFTRSITRGIEYIHGKGYVHCDIKPQNLLVCESLYGKFDVKIADFGLSKKTGEERIGFVGTPLYMSPESIILCNEHESPADVWALGCVVLEMFTGKFAWKCLPNANVCNGLLLKIGFSDEIPEIPGDLSYEGKDFLRKCFVRDPRKRWTADMLLKHPFISGIDDDDDGTVTLVENDKLPSPSPRSAFDFPEWSTSLHLNSIERSKPDSCSGFCGEIDRFDCCSSLVMDRVRRLSNGVQPNWSDSDSWITVRETEVHKRSLAKSSSFTDFTWVAPQTLRGLIDGWKYNRDWPEKAKVLWSLIPTAVWFGLRGTIAASIRSQHL